MQSSLNLDRSIVPVIITVVDNDDHNNINDRNAKINGNDNPPVAVALSSTTTTIIESNSLLLSSSLLLLQSLQGTYIIQSVCELLCLSSSYNTCYETATVLFHRYYYYQYYNNNNNNNDDTSKNDCDINKKKNNTNNNNIWCIAMASTLLAIKIEEGKIQMNNDQQTNVEQRPYQQSTIRQMILAFIHMYRRLTFLLIPDKNDNDKLLLQQLYNQYTNSIAYPNWIQQLSYNEKIQLLQVSIPSISINGPMYSEWHKNCIYYEQLLLHQFGFILYWIPTNHSIRFLYPFINQLSLLLLSAPVTTSLSSSSSVPTATPTTAITITITTDDDNEWKQKLFHNACMYSKISYRINVCIRYSSEIITCAVLYLAALDLNILHQLTLTTTSSLTSVSSFISNDVLDHNNRLEQQPHQQQQQQQQQQCCWWNEFCGPGHDQDISDCCNCILEVCAGINYDTNNNNKTTKEEGIQIIQVQEQHEEQQQQKKPTTSTTEHKLEDINLVWLSSKAFIINNNNSNKSVVSLSTNTIAAKNNNDTIQQQQTPEDVIVFNINPDSFQWDYLIDNSCPDDIIVVDG